MSGESSSKVLLKRRRLSGYNIFHRELLQSSDRNTRLCDINKAAGEKWQTLNQEDREAYNRKAKEEISSPRPVELRKMLNELSKLINSIKENLWAELFFTLVKDNDHYCGGTEKGLAFLQSEVPWIPYSFIGYLHKPGTVRENSQTQSVSHSLDQMRREVEQIFNQRYGEASGDGRKLPYSKIPSLGIVACGLPDGVVLKRPSSYGRRQLQLIIDSKDKLKFNLTPSDVYTDADNSNGGGSSAVTPSDVYTDANNSNGGGSSAVTLSDVYTDADNSIRGGLSAAMPGGISAGAHNSSKRKSSAGAHNSSKGKSTAGAHNSSKAKSTAATPGDDHDCTGAHSSSVGKSTAGLVNTNKVVLLAEGSRQPVGLGTVCDQGTIHNHRVPDGYIKVIIDYIKPKTRLPLPMPFRNYIVASLPFGQNIALLVQHRNNIYTYTYVYIIIL